MSLDTGRAAASLGVLGHAPPNGDAALGQTTLAEPVAVTGFGYFSGADITVEFRPAKVDSGITFVRADLDPDARIPARVEYRVEAPRRTVLVHNIARVEMVEHIMAALAGLRISNCEVWVSGEEMPGGDGSSSLFVEALDSVERVAQEAARPQLIVREVTRLGDAESWIEARPSPDGRFSVKFRLDYPDAPAIGRQTVRFDITPETFRTELSPCRTFMLQGEAEWLRSQGLGQRVGYQDLLIFDEEGPIENELRFDDECARHKALDVVGDLGLAGCDLVGEFIAHRSGHRLNAELVKALLQEEQIITPNRITA